MQRCAGVGDHAGRSELTKTTMNNHPRRRHHGNPNNGWQQ
jgi:hypothetical protein